MFSTSAVALPMLLLATLLSATSAAGAGAGAGAGSSSAAAAAAAPRPHLVLVLGDDLGFYDTQIYNPTSPTPNLKSLAEQGVRLDRHCECAATRAAAQSAALRADATTDCGTSSTACLPACRRAPQTSSATARPRGAACSAGASPTTSPPSSRMVRISAPTSCRSRRPCSQRSSPAVRKHALCFVLWKRHFILKAEHLPRQARV
jgi:hypothetical protein